MAETNKRMILVKGLCTHCNAPVGVEVPEPEPIIQKVIAPCECGMDSETRQAKYISTAISMAVCVLLLSAMGSCISSHYFTTQQVRAIKGKEMELEVQKAGVSPFPETEFQIGPKLPPPPKKEEGK